jgi:hypothetical protein
LDQRNGKRQVEFAGTTLNLARLTGDQRVCGVALRMSERIMSDEFDGLDVTEKAGIEAALNRCRGIAAQIASEWPAPGSEDTELGVLMELEVGHGETEVYPRVQA